MSLRLACPLLLALGLVLMLPFEEWYTRILGVASLVGFIVTGLFMVATPEYLSRRDDD